MSADRPTISTPAIDGSAPFTEQLDALGPDRQQVAYDVPAAEAYCSVLSRSHYENFHVVSWLLPKRFHRHFHNVYAYCRWADDLSDEVDGADRSLELLAWWRNGLDACYARLGGAGGSTPDEPIHPVFVALAGTIRECNIPRQPFADLISAFEQDQRVSEYETFDELHDYCRRSADPVGRLVLHIVGEATERNLAWSDSICTGLQLANFWQDVARDADIGRTYLPREDRCRFKYTDDDLQDRVTNGKFLKLMRFEVDRARGFLEAGLPLVAVLPGRLRIDIDLFARGGLAILDRIEAAGYRVWERRPTVGKWTAARLLAGSCLRSMWRSIFGTRRHVDIGNTTEPIERPRDDGVATT